MSPNVVFLVTTARSGTQWLHQTLSSCYADKVHAEHEPLGYLYDPRHCLRNPDGLARLAEQPRLQAHFDDIDQVLESGKSYVELGFPAFAMAPLLRQRFGDRLRLLQLVRNPARVAASLVTHHWYTPGLRQDIRDSIALTPGDPGVTLGAYADRWDRMSPFEKGLFYWYEVHRFGLEQERLSPAGQYHRARFEDLLKSPEALKGLLAFLDLPPRDAAEAAPQRKIDRFHHKTAQAIDFKAIRRHPEIIALAEELGYRIRSSDLKALAQRYQKGRLWVLGKAVKDALSRPLAATQR
ncbi:MAG: sulfotransferase domain-containing protein [Rhodobacteraceae bacterium]|nr:sulfotransferase domain-containing protein [Paracoccaceae bacterium]